MSENGSILVIRFLGGPFAGREFFFEKTFVTLGRSSESDVTVGDSLLSRVHLEFFKIKDRGWFVRDLESKNGTWHDGLRLTEALSLEESRVLRAGHSLFEIKVRNTFNPELESKSISFRFNPQNFSVENEAKINALSVEEVRAEHHRLSVIYRIQNELSRYLDENEIFARLLRTLMQEIVADYCYVCLFRQDHFEAVAGLNYLGESITPDMYPYSNTILDYVRKKKEGILSNDIKEDKRLLSETVIAEKSQSIICVPLNNNKNFIGAIYITVAASKRFFAEEELQLVAGIGHSVSMSVVNSRLVRKDLRNERMAALGATAASLSHYIKNILTGVDGCLYLLKMGIEDGNKELTDEAMDILSRNHTRLSGLVLDLLNLAKEDNLDFQLHNVSEIVTDVLQLVTVNIEKAGVELQISSGLELCRSLTADVDGMAIHRVLLNLINNAKDSVMEKYGDESSGCISIDLRTNEDEDNFEISVRDNGLGIESDKIDSVFEMFYTAKDEGGTGLGLAVSKRLIESHGGKLHVDSEFGSYANFVIQLPLSHQNTQTLAFN